MEGWRRPSAWPRRSPRGAPASRWSPPSIRGSRAPRPAAYSGSADLYLCPTTIASVGVTLLEAMACGTPMVVSDNHGFRSVIAGGAEALVIPKDDPAVWAETTIALLGDPARREAMARAGVDKAQRFAWPRIARQELGVYERVLGRSAKPARRPTRRASELASTTG